MKKITGSWPRVSDSVGLGWGLRICIFNKVLGNADADGPAEHFKSHCSKKMAHLKTTVVDQKHREERWGLGVGGFLVFFY